MPRTQPKRNRASVRVRARRIQSSTLDARALEAVERFVRVLARCGCTPEDIAREAEKACRKIPRSLPSKALAALREMDDASHVLTLWFSDPAYLDSRGNPLPLPLRGAGGSLETLARRVDGGLDPREVLRYLSRRGALRRLGTRYVPKDRLLSLRGSGGPDNFRHLRGLLGMLRTLEHNGQPKGHVPGWFEVFAENPNFPLTAREAFDRRLRRMGMRFLCQVDADMHRRERSRRSDDGTVRMSVHVYRSEEPVAVSRRASKPRRRRSG
jgi:hypothetical protein